MDFRRDKKFFLIETQIFRSPICNLKKKVYKGWYASNVPIKQRHETSKRQPLIYWVKGVTSTAISNKSILLYKKTLFL